MNWVVLGCGYVGTRLANALLADRERVRVCARNVTRLAPLGDAGADVHRVDAATSHAFGPALFGVTSPVVVYSIPPVPGLPPGEAVRRAAAAAQKAGAQRFIYLGSTAVYGPSAATPTEADESWVDEANALAIGDAEALPRIADEGAVESAQLAGLHTVVLRLAAIYGPGRGVRERLKKGNYEMVDEGRHYFSRVHVDDVVGVIRRAAERALAGAKYCVADDRPCPQREYVDWLTARLGTAPPRSVASLEPGKRARLIRNRRISNQLLRRELDYAFHFPSYIEGEQAIEREAELQTK